MLIFGSNVLACICTHNCYIYLHTCSVFKFASNVAQSGPLQLNFHLMGTGHCLSLVKLILSVSHTSGAGKTTLISVLTGLYEPTSGKAMIAGYDLATEIDAIHHHLGVCPQFDIHHAELTAEEHLYFYARLKGVKWGKEKSVVEKALRQVGVAERAWQGWEGK